MSSSSGSSRRLRSPPVGLGNRKILIALPERDFGVTGVAVPWKLFTVAGGEVHFATESGVKGMCDPKLLTGVIFGQMGAEADAKAYFSEMIGTEGFQFPLKFSEIDFMAYDAILLPGGNAKGMKQFLECELLRRKLVPFFKDQNKIIGAIGHGVLVLSRTIDPSTNKSILYKRTTTALSKKMQRLAYYLTFWKVGKYFRTYDTYVEDEVKKALENPEQQFYHGPSNIFIKKDEGLAYVCVDKNYISARWSGDAHFLAKTMVEKMVESNDLRDVLRSPSNYCRYSV